MTRLLALPLLLVLAVPAAAGKTDSQPQRTYWDQIMEGQAHRSLYRGARLMDRGDYAKALSFYERTLALREELGGTTGTA